MVKKGEIVYGKITNILGYGAFVSVDEYDGLIHISEFSDNYVRSIGDFVSIGQQVKLKVLEVDESEKRLRLSYKFLNKSRGVKGVVPTYKIGFKTVENNINEFVKSELSKMKEKPQDTDYLNSMQVKTKA